MSVYHLMSDEELHAIAPKVFESLDVMSHQLRYSTHYPSGIYYFGITSWGKVRLSFEDDVNFQEYQFELHIDSAADVPLDVVARLGNVPRLVAIKT